MLCRFSFCERKRGSGEPFIYEKSEGGRRTGTAGSLPRGNEVASWYLRDNRRPHPFFTSFVVIFHLQSPSADDFT